MCGNLVECGASVKAEAEELETGDLDASGISKFGDTSVRSRVAAKSASCTHEELDDTRHGALATRAWCVGRRSRAGSYFEGGAGRRKLCPTKTGWARLCGGKGAQMGTNNGRRMPILGTRARAKAEGSETLVAVEVTREDGVVPHLALSPNARLTRAELETLKLAGQGLTNERLAAVRGVSLGTVASQ